jgi:dipeptidyl aminopeptidase/acylaminoacyl peptidase
MRPSRYILPFGGAMITGAFGVAAIVARRINGARRSTGMDDYAFSPWELEVAHESVEFRTDDGITLRGWWFPRAETERVVIGCPGHRRGKHDLLGIGSGLWRAGNNVLLFDFRGCWDSDPAAQSLAYKEIPDLDAAIKYAAGRVDRARVGIIGYSMGAAVGILVAARDTSVRAVVADSSFATMRDVVAQALRRRRFPPHPFLALTDMYNRWYYGYPFAAVRPVDFVAQISPRPILLIHGGQDVVVPVNHVHRLYEAAREPKELWIVPGAAHCGAYFDDRTEYVARVTAFFARALAKEDS